MSLLETIFKLKENKTDFRTELRAGTITFLSMAYIIIVQPAVLSRAGMDTGAVMVATCLSSALATFIMGFYANYPIALAPGMGENFYFAQTLVRQLGIPWQTSLGIVFISGLGFLAITVLKVREAIINAVPRSLKNAIAVGIGLFIGFLGLKEAGIIQMIKAGGDVTLAMGNLHNPGVLLSIFGLLIISFLLARRVKGAIFFGMLITFLVGLPFRIVKFHGIFSSPPSISPTLFKMNLKAALNWEFIVPIIVFFFMDVFDTVGTLIGVSEQAGFIDEKGRLPRAERALFADAIGTVAGAALGTSTVTSYIESATGVAEGGRTGLTSVITGLYFILALFFYPIVKSLAGGYQWKEGAPFVFPITAPVLIIVGAMMFSNIKKVELEDPTEYVPAVLTILGMPLTMSIANGLGFGFISYAILKLLAGKAKEVHPVMYVLALVFILKFALV